MNELDKQMAILRARADGFRVIAEAIEKYNQGLRMELPGHKHTKECEE